MVGMQANFDTPPSMPLRTHISAITSQRSVWKRNGPVERARAREETTLPGSDLMKVGLASRVSSRTSPMISPAMFWYSGRPRCWPEAPEDLPQFVVGVARDVEAAQSRRATPVLQFVVHLGQQGRG